MQSLSVALLLALLLPLVSFAHETKTIGSLNVLLHMEPQDSPVIREPAQLFFAFTDSRGRFDLEICDCSVAVLHAGKVLFDENLKPAEELYGSNVAVAHFTFPEKGIFQIRVSGAPRPSGAFDAFSLAYDVRIERENISQSPVNPIVPRGEGPAAYIYGAGILLACGMIIFGFELHKKKK